MIRAFVVILLALLVTPAMACTSVDGLPDPSPDCTPGAVDPAIDQSNIGSTICKPGYSKSVRPPVSVTNRIKKERMQAYGLDGQPMHAFELDHLISLELAGAPADPLNLWPEHYSDPDGAHDKDKVENELHRLVCSGKLPLSEAQRRIASDWRHALDGLSDQE